MSELVEKLASGDHLVELSLHPEKTIKALRDCLDRGYIHIKFTQTRGGTEIGVTIDKDACDFSDVDFQNGTGIAHIVGSLTLDYVRVRCIADIDIKTFGGKGHLAPQL